MLTESQKNERNRNVSRRWYKENSEGYNEERRKKYADDPEAREKARQRAAEYRKSKPKITRQLHRELNGKRVPVFSTGQVAEMMGRTPQMLRNWQKEGMIPDSVFPDKHRLYTKKQVRMLVALDACIREHGGSWAATEVKRKIRDIHKRW